MRKFSTSAALLALLQTVGAAGAPILGVTASTTNGTNAGNILNTANGSGLNGGQLPTSTHNAPVVANCWQTDVATGTINLTFALNGLFDVSGMAVWNANGTFGQSSRGIRGVTVLSSVGGLIFNPILGAPAVFSQGPASAPSSAEVFAWTPVTATHVRFLVSSNYGSPLTLFNEALFDGSRPAAAPEVNRDGALVPLFMVCLVLLGVAPNGRPRIAHCKPPARGSCYLGRDEVIQRNHGYQHTVPIDFLTA
ncbi:hypothetical protein IV102_05235 [bacterium]|nr:hypothetical protein [bacterium]